MSHDYLSPDPPYWGLTNGATLFPMVVETWIEMLREKLKHISSLLRLGASVDAFLGAWTSNVHPLVW
jgi:hypothetical protein